MYLILFTIIYCALTQVLNIDLIFASGIYLASLCIAKGWLSEELKDVFNLKKTKYLYRKIGLKYSLMDLLSLILIFSNPFLIGQMALSFFEIMYIIFLIAVVYRYIFWGMTKTIKRIFKVHEKS
ncbi:hypothetical protein ACTWQB_14675 [Piscibacillus sp. B03]|uniref:hypothetical protein n=1 Tax=Piscibacillus sp. B03 TaxID=3457430 RepID=UPI003FCDCC48